MPVMALIIPDVNIWNSEKDIVVKGYHTILIIVLLFVAILSVPITGNTDYREVEVKDGGIITGKVSFSGALPDDAVERFTIAKNSEVCGEGDRQVIWVDVKDRALRGTFVFIDAIRQGKKWPTPKGGRYLIDQRGCRFVPWAQVVKRGPITIRNSDAGVLHNVNAREIIEVKRGRVVKRTMFNIGQPYPGDIVKELKPRRSSFIVVGCETHNFMFSFIMAPEHPYAVVVNEDGSYVLDNVPPGHYTLKAWHPKLGMNEVELTVPARGKVEANFDMKTSR